MRRLGLVVAASWLLVGCPSKRLTGEEAREALDESSVASQAAALMSTSIEISTDFTIGSAVEEAAEEVRDFVVAQLPCAEVTLEDATLTIEYGAHEDEACTYRGQEFAGTHSIHMQRNEDDNVVVEHTWSDFNNEVISVTGEATVTWSRGDRSRHVVHELTWTRLSDMRMGVGSGDRVQSALAGGWSEGVRINGTRGWEGERGRFELEIDGVEMRWADPVPQAGSWALQTPFDKTVRLSFERVDEDSIAVTVANGGRSFDFQVSSIGTVSRR